MIFKLEPWRPTWPEVGLWDCGLERSPIKMGTRKIFSSRGGQKPHFFKMRFFLTKIGAWDRPNFGDKNERLKASRFSNF